MPLGLMAAALKPDILAQGWAHSRDLPHSLQELVPLPLLLLQSPLALAASARHLKNVMCFEGHLSYLSCCRVIVLGPQFSSHHPTSFTL